MALTGTTTRKLTTLALAIRHADAFAAGDLNSARNLADVDYVLALTAARDAAQARALTF